MAEPRHTAGTAGFAMPRGDDWESHWQSSLLNCHYAVPQNNPKYHSANHPFLFTLPAFFYFLGKTPRVDCGASRTPGGMSRPGTGAQDRREQGGSTGTSGGDRPTAGSQPGPCLQPPSG